MKRMRLPSALATAVAIAVLTAVLWWAQRRVSLPDVPLLYLPLVLAATLLGALPGVVAAIGSTLAFHIFFTDPQASFRVAAVRDLISIFVYLATTIVITHLISRARASASEAARRAEIASTLQRLASSGLGLLPTDHPDRVAEAIASSLGSPACAIWMRQADGLHLWGACGVGLHKPTLPAAAAWAERETKAVAILGEDGQTLRCAPIRGAGGLSGTIAVEVSPASRRFLDDPEFLEGLSGLVALFWTRAGTAHRELEAEAAKRSDELKSALLSMVSHELRSPLTAIKATVESLLKGTQGTDRESLAAIEVETDRLARLVRNLLDASRIEAGQLRPATHAVRLRRLLGELADRNDIGEDRIALAVPAELFVEVDPVLLDQVLQNLIENAERHGKPPVRVEAERSDGLVRVRVSDQGPGVQQEDLGRIFDRFVRRERGGLGLGLALCRAIVEAHGGTIQAANAPGGGLVVSFTLPAAEGAS